MLDSALRSVTYLLEPVGLVWLAVIWAALWALRRRQAALAVFLALLALGISVVGSTGLPDELLERLERPYAGRDLQALPVCDAVVVLGGGARPSRYDVGGLDLTAAGDRLVMGAELLRRGKARYLVVGGGAHTMRGQPLVEADLVRRWVTALGLTSAPVISLSRCLHTRDEAVKVAALCRERGWTNVLLVTSASHMKRAEATFRTAGVPVVGVPCDFQTEVSVMTESERVWVPTVAGFQKLSSYVHEQLGWWTYRWRGWIALPTPTASPSRLQNRPPAGRPTTASAAP